jgi:hypothetical protein
VVPRSGRADHPHPHAMIYTPVAAAPV